MVSLSNHFFGRDAGSVFEADPDGAGKWPGTSLRGPARPSFGWLSAGSNRLQSQSTGAERLNAKPTWRRPNAQFSERSRGTIVLAFVRLGRLGLSLVSGAEDGGR